jgi:hypothetical protein
MQTLVVVSALDRYAVLRCPSVYPTGVLRLVAEPIGSPLGDLAVN